MDIWAFWEPKEQVPYYLQLCMETWKKFLPNEKINLLDFSNVREYADIDKYGENLFSGKFSLPQIADAIRAMILAEHGGIWMDCDTVLLNDSVKDKLVIQDECQTVFWGDIKSKTASVAVISAKEKSDCMERWTEYCNLKIHDFHHPEKDFWAYLGNLFINPYLKNASDVKIYDIRDCWPEMNISVHPQLDRISKYKEFYFYNNYKIKDMKNDMLMLHNSWTPDLFKKMNKDEFLACSCTLSNILIDIIGMDRNKKALISYSMLEKKNEDKKTIKEKALSYNQEIVFLGDKIGFNMSGNVETDIRNDIFLPAKKTNFNFYRYNIPKGLKEFYIKISGVSAKFDEYTAGIFDFKNSKILHYETCKVSGEHVFHFLVGKSIDNIALCIYAGITRHTAGNEMRIKELAIMYRNYPG